MKYTITVHYGLLRAITPNYGLLWSIMVYYGRITVYYGVLRFYYGPILGHHSLLWSIMVHYRSLHSISGHYGSSLPVNIYDGEAGLDSNSMIEIATSLLPF